MNEYRPGWIQVLLGFALGSLLAVILGSVITEGRFKREAVERGVARYHPVTGEWEWSVGKTPELVKDEK